MLSGSVHTYTLCRRLLPVSYAIALFQIFFRVGNDVDSLKFPDLQVRQVAF